MVHTVFLASPKPTWPYPALNFEQEMAGIKARLADLESKHPGVVRFTGGELLLSGASHEAWEKSTADADAILVLDLTTSTSSQFQALQKMETPLLLFQRPLTSWAFMNFAEYIRKGKKADMINSSDFSDLVPHLYMLRTIHHLRHSKILVVRPGAAARDTYEPWTRAFGTAVELPPYAEFKAAFDSVSARKAADAAAEFTRGALRVVEPKAADITDSMRFYLGALEVLRQAKANALTIDCLGGFRRGDLPAYPCVAFSKLNDAGMYGVCEADFASTMTQLLVTSYSGKPGFVSDPTFDTSRNEVIHAHCVAATCLRGLGGAPSPYTLRTHMEDEKGVSIQVEMPVRETVTVAKFADPRTLLVSTGEVTANLDDRRGCRTKIVTRVADARKMAEGYTGGLHRVIFYGDYAQATERMGRLM
ncbi:MAG: hypothetical protein NTY38_04860, partial [Acidobacteria bacterium]|nr:hypothetical protein [Acidobacteriota bacterium]